MKPVREFEEYIEEGIVDSCSPDKSRAKSLKKEAKKAHVFLMEVINKVEISNDNANNVIKIAYDIIMERVRARMLEEGYNASGKGAHESEVSFMRKMGFNERDVQFCNQLRYFRNGIMYYGKLFDKEYAEMVVKFLEKI